MSIWNIAIEIGKIFSPLLAVVVGACMAAYFYSKNKRVDYGLKLAEKALEEVYNPIITKLEKESQNPDFGYEGLSAIDLKEIGEIFSNNRHLVHDDLMNILWQYEEDIHRYLTGDGKKEKFPQYIKVLDGDSKFYKELTRIRKEHLKNIGFYNE